MGDIDCLKPCVECNRHVRCGERACPFCGAAVGHFMRAPEYRVMTRLGRSATFSLGAALGAIGFAFGCSSDGAPAPEYGAPCSPPTCPSPSAGSGGNAAAGADAGGNNAGGSPQGGGAPR
jgi:hypothetical protein